MDVNLFKKNCNSNELQEPQAQLEIKKVEIEQEEIEIQEKETRQEFQDENLFSVLQISLNKSMNNFDKLKYLEDSSEYKILDKLIYEYYEENDSLNFNYNAEDEYDFEDIIEEISLKYDNADKIEETKSAPILQSTSSKVKDIEDYADDLFKGIESQDNEAIYNIINNADISGEQLADIIKCYEEKYGNSFFADISNFLFFWFEDNSIINSITQKLAEAAKNNDKDALEVICKVSNDLYYENGYSDESIIFHQKFIQSIMENSDNEAIYNIIEEGCKLYDSDYILAIRNSATGNELVKIHDKIMDAYNNHTNEVEDGKYATEINYLENLNLEHKKEYFDYIFGEGAGFKARLYDWQAKLFSSNNVAQEDLIQMLIDETKINNYLKEIQNGNISNSDEIKDIISNYTKYRLMTMDNESEFQEYINSLGIDCDFMAGDKFEFKDNQGNSYTLSYDKDGGYFKINDGPIGEYYGSIAEFPKDILAHLSEGIMNKYCELNSVDNSNLSFNQVYMLAYARDFDANTNSSELSSDNSITTAQRAIEAYNELTNSSAYKALLRQHSDWEKLCERMNNIDFTNISKTIQELEEIGYSKDDFLEFLNYCADNNENSRFKNFTLDENGNLYFDYTDESGNVYEDVYYDDNYGTFRDKSHSIHHYIVMKLQTDLTDFLDISINISEDNEFSYVALKENDDTLKEKVVINGEENEFNYAEIIALKNAYQEFASGDFSDELLEIFKDGVETNYKKFKTVTKVAATLLTTIIAPYWTGAKTLAAIVGALPDFINGIDELTDGINNNSQYDEILPAFTSAAYNIIKYYAIGKFIDSKDMLVQFRKEFTSEMAKRYGSSLNEEGQSVLANLLKTFFNDCDGNVTKPFGLSNTLKSNIGKLLSQIAKIYGEYKNDKAT